LEKNGGNTAGKQTSARLERGDQTAKKTPVI